MTASTNAIAETGTLRVEDMVGAMKRYLADMPPPPPPLFRPFAARDLQISFEREAPIKTRFAMHSFTPEVVSPMKLMGMNVIEHELPSVPVFERVRPRCPAKRDGRRRTRRAWKRAHPPHQKLIGYEDPPIFIVSGSVVASPQTVALLRGVYHANS